MTVKELRKLTKCPIFIEWTDGDGAVRRQEWTGGVKDYGIASLKIIHAGTYGFSLCVELEDE